MEGSLFTLLDSHAPSDCAIVGRVSLSYAQVRIRVEELAAHLQSRFPYAKCAGICTSDPVELALLLLALNRAGLSVFLAHPATPPATLTRLVDELHAELIFGSASLPSPEFSAERIELRAPDFSTNVAQPAKPGRPAYDLGPPCVLLFTSGTEGAAKAVMRLESRLQKEVKAVARLLSIAANTRVLCPVSPSGAYGLLGLLSTLAGGGTFVAKSPRSGRQFLRVAAHDGADIVVGTPAFYNLWSYQMPVRSGMPASNLKACLSAGSPLGMRVREAFEAAFGSTITQHYGMTECGAITFGTGNEAGDCVGHPMPGVLVDIASPNARGEGEIVVRGEYISAGYLSGSGPRSHPDHMVRTGDLGRLDGDGCLHVVGRLSELINVNGLKVNPTDVEDLFAADERVKDIAVVGLPRANGDDHLIACVVCDVDAEVEAIVRPLLRQLAPHQHPRRFLRVPEVARTASGKIRRSEMAKRVVSLLASETLVH